MSCPTTLHCFCSVTSGTGSEPTANGRAAQVTVRARAGVMRVARLPRSASWLLELRLTAAEGEAMAFTANEAQRTHPVCLPGPNVEVSGGLKTAKQALGCPLD